MRFQFITGHYNNEGNITIFLRGEDLKRYRKEITGFEYDFYVPSEENIPDHPALVSIEQGYKDWKNRPVTRIIMEKPTDVGGGYFNGQFVAGFKESFQRPMQADIKSVHNMLIHAGVSSGIEADQNKSTIYYKELIPIEFSLPPFFTFVDIEVFTKTRFPDQKRAEKPIVCATVYDIISKKYTTVIVESTIKGYQMIVESSDRVVIKVETEELLIQFLDKYFHTLFDLVGAWNLSFDDEYYHNRARRLGIRVSSFSELGTCKLDLLMANAMINKPLGNDLANTLMTEKVRNEDGTEITVAEKVGYEPWKPEFWEKPELHGRAIKVNRSHVEGLVELNKKFNYIDMCWGLKNFAGMPDTEETVFHGNVADAFALRWYNKAGIIVPSRPPRTRQRKRHEGGIVFQPKEGIYEDVAIFDMSRYYPSIIIGYRITFEDIKEGEEGQFPKMCKHILRKRDEYEEDLDKLEPNTLEYDAMEMNRDVVKYIGETIYGILSSSDTRWSDKEKAAKITEKARKGLLRLAEFAEKMI